jgi:hypothetical protein
MNEKYITCIVIAHGGILTEHTKQNTYDTIEFDTSINMNICTFAAPTEKCSYPPDLVIELKNYLLRDLTNLYNEGRLNDINNVSALFNQLVNQSQEDVLGTRYHGKDWAGFFSKNPHKTERWIVGHKYVDKKFDYDNTGLGNIELGVYILVNNVGIPFGSVYNHETLLEFIRDIEKLNVTNLFMWDMTCSVVYEPDEKSYIQDKRSLNLIGRQVMKYVDTTRGGNKKKNRKMRNKSKNKKSLKMKMKMKMKKTKKINKNNNKTKKNK